MTLQEAVQRLASGHSDLTTHEMAQLLLLLPNRPIKSVEVQGGPEYWSDQLCDDTEVQVGIRTW